MATPNRWLNTLLYSIIGSAVIWLLIGLVGSFVFEFPFKYWFSPDVFFDAFLVAFVIPFLIMYLVLNLAFSSFSKRNISHLYELLPDLNRQKTAKNLEGLSEQISSLSEVKSKEIDLLTERENYRREFLGNVSHELKTPLFSIQGYVLTLIEGGVEDTTIRDKYLNRINKSVDRLTYIVKDLDLITELESGNLKLEKKPFNIVALAREIFDLLEIKASNNQVVLKIDHPVDVPIKVMGDRSKIEQVLTNLVVNAINHSSRESVVTIRFQNLGGKIKTSIKDTGMGIKPEHIDRIFERFYRVDKSRSRTNGGSGLGLAIVKHILEAHGEKITVKSEFEKGSEFTFLLEKV